MPGEPVFYVGHVHTANVATWPLALLGAYLLDGRAHAHVGRQMGSRGSGGTPSSSDLVAGSFREGEADVSIANRVGDILESMRVSGASATLATSATRRSFVHRAPTCCRTFLN